MSYDFTRLTDSQQELLTFGGWTRHCGRKQPGNSTVKKLLDRGLIEKKEVDKSFRFYIPEYTVPLPVHMAWCERCSKLIERTEKNQ